MIKIISVKTLHRNYKIFAGKGVLSKIPVALKECGNGDPVIITTRKLLNLHGHRLKKVLCASSRQPLFLTVREGEESKSAPCAFELIEKIAIWDKRKKPILLAFGGGVIGDLAGFIASIYKRGVPYIQVPTTLLAQIDSSIGGKTAIDLPFGKNLVGAFYQPAAVVADTLLLKTLPLSEIKAGLAETIKYALIQNGKFFKYLSKNSSSILKKDPQTLEKIVFHCAGIKARVVEKDEFDNKNIRIILNFGHTIGHALEAASHFSLSHGAAVCVGMVAACKLSVALGLLDQKINKNILHLIQQLSLPINATGINPRKILDSLPFDKKFGNRNNRFVLLTGIGSTKIVSDVPADLIQKILAEILLDSKK